MWVQAPPSPQKVFHGIYYTRKHPADIELLLEIATETV
jgi:hypothetical protein